VNSFRIHPPASFYPTTPGLDAFPAGERDAQRPGASIASARSVEA
jgi:hypothetical protein